MHPLLRTQLKEHFGAETPPAAVTSFVEAVWDAYERADAERLRLESALESTARDLEVADAELRVVYESLPDLVLRVEPSGRIREIRGGGGADYGFEPSLLRGEPVSAFPAASMAGTLTLALREWHRSGRPQTSEYAIRTPTGEARFEARLFPATDGSVMVLVRRLSTRGASADPTAAGTLALLAPDSAETAARTSTVLLVEDEEQLRELESYALEMGGHRVLVAESGEAALEIFKADPDVISILVTDMVMPGMNGQELYEALSRLRPGLPVLYISGHVPGSIVEQGLFDPGMAYLPKPFGLDELATRVKEILAA